MPANLTQPELENSMNDEKVPNPSGHETSITVNNKPVVVTGPRLKGSEIKQAAIDQGVAIKLTFILSQIEPGARPKIVGDNDVVTVNKNSVFVANDDDDDS
jgi:Multiubiquitin